MKSSCLSVLAAVTMLSLGCSATAGEDPTATPDGSAGVVSTPTSVPPAGTLGAQPIDLSGVPLNPNPKYRLVVAFSQFDDDFAPTPIDVALDVPFDITATTIDLSALRAPAANTIFCPRKDKRRGEVPGACDAGAAYHVAIGYLMIVEDANRNGKADFGNSGGDGRATLLAPDSRAGIAVGAVLYDETSGSILPQGNGGKPILLDGPVPKGFSIYEAYRPEGGAIFDRLRPPTAPLRFSVKGPNLT
jgi:hypothetical protein